MMVKSDKMASQKDKGYNDPAFVKYRTQTLVNAVKETASVNAITVFREQILNLKNLSIIYRYGDIEPYDLLSLDRIIDFVERSKSLLYPKYTEPVWHVLAELYHLKTMISNQHIYNTIEAKQKANEIMRYVNEHLM